MPRRLATVLAVGLTLFLATQHLLGLDAAGPLARLLLRWATVLGAFALLLGVANLLAHHLRRILRREDGWPYSVLLVFSALLVGGWGLHPGSAGPGEPAVGWAFRHVLAPAEGSILALGAFFVVSAAYRSLRVRSAATAAMTVGALAVLILQIPEVQVRWPPAQALQAWLLQVPVAAGLRGLAMGVALGSVGLAASILLGSWRPYLDT